jgi:RHS repeat-associated protein
VTTYDVLDRPVYVTDANGIMLTNTYDKLNRVLTRGYPDGGVERFGYSALGLIAYTNQINMTNYYAYDAAGRKTYETNANGEILKYTNNAAGDLLSLTDGKNQTTKWNYDRYGRVTNKVDQAGLVVLKYFYDTDDRLTNRWSYAMGTTYYTNDAVGNLTYIKYPSSTRVILKYDWLNRLTNMLDAAGTATYAYTAGDQVLTESQPFSNSTITNTYVNRLRTSLSLQQPTGVWTNKFVYDLAGRMTNVTSPAGSFGYMVGASSSGSKLIKKLLLPNTSYITNTFDSVARLTGTYLDNSANSILDSAFYGYNKANQRTAFTNAAGTYVQYTYDNIGQLTIAASSVSSENRGYFYDSAWNLNRLTNNGVTSTYTVDNKNELTGWPLGPGNYDGNGNRINQNSGSGATTLAYDDENRLTSWVQSTAHNSTFTYDGLGRLRARNEYTWNGSVWVLSTTTWYIYDGSRVIQERDGFMAGNTPLVSYTRGTDLSASLEGAGGIGGLLARSSGYSGGNWSTHYFYHADGNGNITYLVDNSQALAASYRYDSFGNVLSSSGTMASANFYRFSSKEIHVNSGLYIYLYRFYDPISERWLNRDPLGEGGFEMSRRTNLRVVRRPSEFFLNANLYNFVRNQPVRDLDVFGLDATTPAGAGPASSPLPIWPPRFPSGGAVNAENPGTLGGINYGNFPDCRSPTPPRPCSTPGARRNVRSAGTITRDCPCTGTVTVQCTQYESCDFYGAGTTAGATFTWTPHSDCAPCPEYAL